MSANEPPPWDELAERMHGLLAEAELTATQRIALYAAIAGRTIHDGIRPEYREEMITAAARTIRLHAQGLAVEWEFSRVR